MREDANNGILMRSLFAGWPPERLAQVYFQALVPHLPNVDICGEYRAITLMGSVHRVCCRAAANSQEGDAEATATVIPGYRQRIADRIRRSGPAVGWARSLYHTWSARRRFAEILARELQDLRPEIVYGLAGNYPVTRVITSACQLLDVPYFMHVADDFVTALYEDQPLSGWVSRRSQRWFASAVEGADGLAAIGPAMAEEYSRRYARSWNWFTTLIDSAAYDPAPRQPDGTIHFVYTGNLQLERWRSLAALALALNQLREAHGFDSRLSVYAPPHEIDQHRDALVVSPITSLLGWVPPSELPAVLAAADVLVHVESFAPAITRLTRLSLSTKIGAYMMSGRCIVAFGPDCLGSMKALHAAGSAVLVNDRAPSVVRARLRGVLEAPEERHELGARGRAWAMSHVEQESGRARFRRELVAALERHRYGRSAGSRRLVSTRPHPPGQEGS
jgi:glycosyltransferase involved in cell wall biosynthesis